MAAKLTPDERTRILELIRAGGTCRGIAAASGRSTDTVRRIAREAGMADAFAREQTKEATAARRADFDLRRTELRMLLLEDAHRLRAQLWEPAVLRGWYQGECSEHHVDQPDFRGQRDIAVAVGILVDKVEVLGRDTEQDHTAVDAWLRSIVGGER